MVVQWLRFCASTPGVMGSILSWGTKDPTRCVVQQNKKIKTKRKQKKSLPQTPIVRNGKKKFFRQ